MICRIRGGKWTAFNIALVPAAEATTDTYVPVRTDTGIVSLVPVDELSERRLTGIRWYALKHRCSGWIRHRDAQRDTMTTLDEAIQQFFDTFT